MRPKATPATYYARLTLLKKLFWLYFLLLIFEGALRKWVVPQLSAPLLVVRDPVGLMIIWEAFRTGKWPHKWTTLLTFLTAGLVGLCMAQVVAGNISWLVGLYGLRSYLLPFPVAFIMAENLDREDLRKFGDWIIFLMLPMSVLAAVQYASPSGSFVNNGAYEGAGQIGYFGAHVRAAGTFSFVSGLESFVALAGAFIVYGFVTPGFAKKWVLRASAFAIIFSIPMMGSRTVVVQLALMIGCMGIGAMMGISQFGKMLRVTLPVALVWLLVSVLPVFSDAMYSMTQRFVGAAVAEGGGSQERTLIYRTARPAEDAISEALSSNDWLGIGIGRGAVAVQAFLTGEKTGIAGEYEFSHEFVEMGLFGGGAFSLIKLFLAIALIGPAMARVRNNESLALLLLPFAVVSLVFAVPEQPTEQGFLVLSMAFCIAAAKAPVQAAVLRRPPAMRRQHMLYSRPLLRGDRRGGL